MSEHCRFKTGEGLTSGEYSPPVKLCKPYSNWTFDYYVTGSCYAGRIQIDSAIEGERFDTAGMVTHTFTSGEINWSGQYSYGSFSVADVPASVIRARCIYMSGSGPEIQWIKVTGR